MTQVPRVLLLTASELESIRNHFDNKFSQPATLSMEEFHFQSEAQKVLDKLSITGGSKHEYTPDEVDSLVIGLFKTHPEIEKRFKEAMGSLSKAESDKQAKTLKELQENYAKCQELNKELTETNKNLEIALENYELEAENDDETADTGKNDAESGGKSGKSSKNKTTKANS